MQLTKDERAKERRLIMDGAWPLFPVLPVKRYSDNDAENCGLIAWRMGIENGPIRVYLVNYFSLGEKADKIRKETGEDGVTYSQLLKDEPVLEYESLEAFFDAGWMGD